jgi:hypothetical protein
MLTPSEVDFRKAAENMNRYKKQTNLKIEDDKYTKRIGIESFVLRIADDFAHSLTCKESKRHNDAWVLLIKSIVET